MSSRTKPLTAGAEAKASSPPACLMLHAAVLLLAVALLVGGCNTIRGFGEDVEAAGGQVSETAEEVQEGM